MDDKTKIAAYLVRLAHELVAQDEEDDLEVTLQASPAVKQLATLMRPKMKGMAVDDVLSAVAIALKKSGNAAGAMKLIRVMKPAVLQRLTK